jgi:RNA polymerase sigma factor (sigma-70 family)
VKVVPLPVRPSPGAGGAADPPVSPDRAQSIPAASTAAEADEGERRPSAESITADAALRPLISRKTIRRKRRRHVKRSAAAAVLARSIDAPPGRIGRDSVWLLAHVLDLTSAADSAPRAPAATTQSDALRSDTPRADARTAAEAAFWPIWLAHRDYLHRYSLRFSSGNMADAEDAMGEAMLKAAQAFPHAAIRNHRAWLLRLVHNACMDRYRVKERQNRLMNDIADDDGQSVPAIVPKPNRSPEDLLGALELITCLQDALMRLPQSLAEPLLLYLDDLPDADIAASLNVTKEVVRKRRQMARDWLRRKISL